jgi:hypothetical protein
LKVWKRVFQRECGAKKPRKETHIFVCEEKVYAKKKKGLENNHNDTVLHKLME